ncbi:MAG: malonic semialdehyde reductase [Alphaproteobacteria bacterium]
MDISTKQVFVEGRTHTNWLEKPVDGELLQRIHELARLGPTSANCCPMRILFIKSHKAKEQLRPCLDEGNVEKTMKAPITAVIAHDLQFYDWLPKLFPHAPARDWFVGNQPLIEETAKRNGTLQGAYFMVVARSLGLDCGPMSGFDNAKLDAIFFADTQIRSNFLCNLGYGDPSKLFPRSPRFEFDEVCRIL